MGRYYEIIKKFACDISYSGMHCYITVRKPYLHAIDKFVSKRCNARAKSQFKELKSLLWKDDEKWFNELIDKKEENLLQNIYRSRPNSVSSNNQGSGIVNDNDDNDVLNDTIIFDDIYNPYFE